MLLQAIPASLEFSDTQRPYVESIRGRLEPKVSPKSIHGLLQGRLYRALDDWGRSAGDTGTEWRFYLLDGERPSSLVPDVAFVSHERLPRSLPVDARDRPRLAPDIAVEILSPGDRKQTLAQKIKLYLQHGAKTVIVLDPKGRTLTVHTPRGSTQREARGLIPIAPYEDLTLDCDALFAGLERFLA